MNEKWAVAFEADNLEEGMFMWARTAGDEIAVFETKIQAQKWVLTCPDVPDAVDKVVFIRIKSH